MDKLVQLKNVQEDTRLSRYAIYKLVEENKFPKPIVLTDRISVWKESEIQKFIDDPAGYADYLPKQAMVTQYCTTLL